MLIAIGLTLSRFLHYLALSMLFGGGLFVFYGAAAPEDRGRLLAWFKPALRGAALIALISAIAWLGFTAADPGGQLAGIANFANPNSVLRYIWPIRLILALCVCVLLLARMSPFRLYVVIAAALGMLASIAWSGHAGMDFAVTAPQHLAADAFHLIAAGIWAGALFCFARLVMPPTATLNETDLRLLHDALARFSGLGPAVVAVLMLSGLFLIGLQGVASVFVVAYGRVLLVKLAMVAGMLALAAANRYRHTPELSRALNARAGLEDTIRELRRSLFAETALALLVLLAAAWLGTAPPP